MSMASGFQGHLDTWSLEVVRDNWGSATRREPNASPSTIAEYNAFRTQLYLDAGNRLIEPVKPQPNPQQDPPPEEAS